MSKKVEENKNLGEDRLIEEKLVRRAMTGDVDAYGVLVEKYQQRIFNLVGRMVDRHDVSEDLAQEVFIKTFEKISTFRFQSSFYTWLYAITLNICRNYYRRKAPSTITIEGNESLEIVEKSSQGETPEEIVSRRQRARIVREVMEQLPQEQKEVLIMCDLEGLSYQEITNILGIPIGTVRSRIFRARSNLKDLLPKYLTRREDQGV